MKNLLFLSMIVLVVPAVAVAQGDTTPYPQATPDPLYPSQRTEDAARRAEDLNRRSDALKMTQNLPPEVPGKNKEFREMIEPLYRSSNDEERAYLAPDPEDSAAYQTFLRQKDTGIFRLVTDRGCADNVKVDSASADCSRLSMPGAGSGYSFRFGDYRMHHISDIVFRGSNFEALGTLNHGIMVDLGDIPIDGLDETSEGIAYIIGIKASKDFTQAADLAVKLQKGIEKDGRKYSSILPVRENSTYAIRSIAYDGEAIRKVGPYAYNEMDLDKRRDVLIVFRVIRLRDGDATIIWKEIDNSKAPKLKPDKK